MADYGVEEYSTVYGVENVSSGGEAAYGTVESGGSQQVRGGLAYNVAVLLSGVQNTSSGGSEDYSQIHGVEHIFAGGSGYGETVYSGGQLSVSGGLDSATSIDSGGKASVFNAGEIVSATIYKGGTENILNGGYEYHSLIYGAEVVSAGGSASHDTVELGAPRRFTASPTAPPF